MSSALLKRSILPILGVALLLRFWGLDYGLPNIYLTDEWFEVKRALKLGAGVFDLERVGKGGYYYLLFVMFGFYFVWMKLFGAISGSSDFLVSMFRDPSGLWLVGRSTTALIGTFNVWLIYRLGVCFRGRAVGLLAALLLAINMMHVRSSHSITVDVPMVCALTGGLLLVYAWRDRESLSGAQYAMLGVVTAIATATKLPAAVFGICVLMLHWIHVRRTGRPFIIDYILDRRLWCFALGSLIYIGLEPGIVIKIGDILRLLLSFFTPSQGINPSDLPYPVLPDRFGAIPVFYWFSLFPLKYTILPLLFVVGVVGAWRRDGFLRHPGIVFALIFAAFLISSKNPHQIYERYVLPLVPIVLLYVASSLVDIHDWLRRRPLWARGMSLLALLVISIPMLSSTIALNIDYGRPDTRTAAKEWVEDNVPAGSSIYLAGGLVRASALTAQLKMRPEQVDEKVYGRLGETGASMTGDKSAFYDAYKRALAEMPVTYELILLDDAADLGRALDEGRGEWALLVQEARELFDHQMNREMFPEQWRLWHATEMGQYEVVQEFARQPGWLGPHLILYRRATHQNRETQP